MKSRFMVCWVLPTYGFSFTPLNYKKNVIYQLLSTKKVGFPYQKEIQPYYNIQSLYST